jgi:hypothetical protein
MESKPAKARYTPGKSISTPASTLRKVHSDERSFPLDSKLFRELRLRCRAENNRRIVDFRLEFSVKLFFEFQQRWFKLGNQLENNIAKKMRNGILRKKIKFRRERLRRILTREIIGNGI